MTFRHLRVVVRGGGELASACARLLFCCGFPVAVLELSAPLAVRRMASFAQAIWSGTTQIEGVPCQRIESPGLGSAMDAGEFIPLAVDPEGVSIRALHPAVVVDGRMAKRNLGTSRADACLVIGLGPGFNPSENVHAVVETQRGADLGRVLWSGPALADTREPSAVMGMTNDRVLRAPRPGVFHGRCRIGERIAAASIVGDVDGTPVVSAIGGSVRGLLADGVFVAAGVKLGDVDPRLDAFDPGRLSDKGRAVAAGVLEAILVALREGRLS